jgi:hypothetical protein
MDLKRVLLRKYSMIKIQKLDVFIPLYVKCNCNGTGKQDTRGREKLVKDNFRVEFMQYYYYTKQAQMYAYNLPPLQLKIKQSILK